MKIWQKIIGLITFIAIFIFGVLTWINAYVDAKYIIEPYNIDIIEERYYMYIDGLSTLMWITYFLSLVLFIILWRKGGKWKTQARMTPAAKVDLTPENNLFLTPEEFGRRGQFYFGLSAFEGFELTDAFAGERDTVCGVDDAVEDGIRHCGVADGVVPVQFGEL